MNSLTIIGNLTADPEHRTTQAGKEVATFTVAVNRKGKDAKEADYFRVTAWNELGNICTKYLSKGKKVAVVGPVSASLYTGQDGKSRCNLEVTAQNVEFLTPRDQGDSVRSEIVAAPKGTEVKKNTDEPKDEGWLPF